MCVVHARLRRRGFTRRGGEETRRGDEEHRHEDQTPKDAHASKSTIEAPSTRMSNRYGTRCWPSVAKCRYPVTCLSRRERLPGAVQGKHDALAHDEAHAFEHGDVLERAGRDRDDVGVLAR